MNLNGKILLTGGSGFLGAHIKEALMKKGVPEANIFTPGSKDFDLRDMKQCEAAVAGCSMVIHAAGITGNAEFHKAHPGQIFYDNLIMGVQLMDAARRAGVKKFVGIGSATEYPKDAPVPYSEKDIWNGYPEETHAPYAVAKTMVMVQGQSYRAQYGFDAIHLIFTGMYGPGEKEDGGPIPSLIKKIADAKKNNVNEVEVWGTGTPTRDFLYVEDAAEAIVQAADKYDGAEPVNIGSGKEISIRELAETLGRLMDFKGKFVFNSTKPGGAMRRSLDVSRAKETFGFSAATDLEAGLKKTIAAHGA